ncbi:MAG: nitrogen regulatory protein 1 [Clostridiales bacterium]|jgi:nitrogen regulatory protein P-II 1|nr:nitrogen regulatory protein 1 [Clostridiales bacterium]
MKKLEIVIRPEKLEEVKSILHQCGVTGLMITNVMGYGNQRGFTQMYRGTEFEVNLLPKIKVETVVSADKVACIVENVRGVVASGTPGDGKIFVYAVEDAIRIRTGESGGSAL